MASGPIATRSRATANGHGPTRRPDQPRRACSPVGKRWSRPASRYYVQRPRRRAPPPRRRPSPSASARWRRPSSCSGRSSAASSSPRSTPAPSRCTSAPRSGTRIEKTEEVDHRGRGLHPRRPIEEDLELILSEIGVTPDWSAAYTPERRPDGRRGQGPAHRRAATLGPGIRRTCSARACQGRPEVHATWSSPSTPAAWSAAAMNEGKSTPINIRVTGKNQNDGPQHRRGHQEQGQRHRRRGRRRGSSSGSTIPQYIINVDRAKAADLGLTQEDVMKNVIAAFNSSIPFNKKNFWIDPKSKNQYFVGVQYPEGRHQVDRHAAEHPDHRAHDAEAADPAAEPGHAGPRHGADRGDAHQIQPTIDVTMGVHGRDLGHVSDDVAKVHQPIRRDRRARRHLGAVRPRTPKTRQSPDGHEDRAQRRIPADAGHLHTTWAAAWSWRSLLIYFLMVGSGQVVRRAAVGHGRPSRSRLVGILPMLYLTGIGGERAVAAGLHLHRRHQGGQLGADDRLRPGTARHEGLTPTEAIRKAAVAPRASDDHDRPGGLLRHGPERAGHGAGQRGERPAGPRDPRRPDGRRARHPLRAPLRSTRCLSATSRGHAADTPSTMAKRTASSATTARGIGPRTTSSTTTSPVRTTRARGPSIDLGRLFT